MSKIVVIIILLFAGYFLLKRSLQPKGCGHSGRPQGEATQRPADVEGSGKPSGRENIPGADRGEYMVFDEMCKSYISKENAITMEQDGKVHYFCSGACRHMFINSNQAGPY
ncbi:MAG: hypothetical protein KAS88_02700 [Deltaproteobacteria bacterium]|nr:hypothetical protein [Deltaproteobacteria bacterium]